MIIYTYNMMSKNYKSSKLSSIRDFLWCFFCPSFNQIIPKSYGIILINESNMKMFFEEDEKIAKV